MHESRSRAFLFFFYFLLSVLLSFLIPSEKTHQFKYFVKYLYYAPYAKSRFALKSLSEFPGRLLKLAKLDSRLEENNRELAEKDLKIRLLTEALDSHKRLYECLETPFYLENKPVPTTVYGMLGENSGLLLLKNRNFKTGCPVAARIKGRWVLVGSIREAFNHDIAVCVLTTNKTSRVSVSGGAFWAVMTGARPGEGILDFIWPSRGVKIEKGEELITSGWDGRFPPGLLCARVKKVSKNRAGEIFAGVEVAYNANSLKDVFILKKEIK